MFKKIVDDKFIKIAYTPIQNRQASIKMAIIRSEKRTNQTPLKNTEYSRFTATLRRIHITADMRKNNTASGQPRNIRIQKRYR